MKILEPNINSVFNIKNSYEFNEIALKIFRYQADNNLVYKEYISHLNLNPAKIKKVKDIPFLPISFFKTHKVTCKFTEEKVFKSSGTTLTTRSNHFVHSLKIYESSFVKAFEYFFGNLQEYTFLALLPSYQEQGDSSLIYMMDYFISKTKNNGSAYFLNADEALNSKIKELEKAEKKYILFGVSYALLDFMEVFPQKISFGKIMETGGMKGRRKELTKDELHQELKIGYGVSAIFSEYGMTELLSQAYFTENKKFNPPPWMKIFIRNTSDPFQFMPTGKRGLINVIDLANIHSCSFIATEDIGQSFENESFSVLGRFDSADVRGCNLMVE